ncbi:glutamate 5-kinase [Jonesiaceae bacterium BS-20]|uniref:Glutamate 5-kinase n=1 Tax=Jonesiaceae bacterium BS-20 TaxID=3120821 RepID=A0AAU7E1P1_9MICO
MTTEILSSQKIQALRGEVASAERIVIKIGSSSLTGPDGRLSVENLTALVEVVAERISQGHQVVLVTSGAVAAGLAPLGLTTRPKDLATAQAAASVGQGLLIARYTAAFAVHDLQVGQILLTADDTKRNGHYRNAQRSLDQLLDLGVIPIINENDAVATEEIRFGDNDRLAALVAHIVRADAMILLTDVDGLYDGPPTRAGTKRIGAVSNFGQIANVEVTSKGSSVGTGGMVTKLESVRIASASGIPVILTLAANVRDALLGREVGTFFMATGNRMSRKRLWLAYAATSAGRVVLDDGAVRAVLAGEASLLPAGVTGVDGKFSKGDPVDLVSQDGKVIGRGLAGFNAGEIPELIGHSTAELRDSHGNGYDRALVHRDDLVLHTRPVRKDPSITPKNGVKSKANKKARAKAARLKQATAQEAAANQTVSSNE